MEAVSIVVSDRSYVWIRIQRLTLTNSVILGNFLNPSLFLQNSTYLIGLLWRLFHTPLKFNKVANEHTHSILIGFSLNWCPVDSMGSRNHTIFPVCSLFHLDDHAIPLSSPHLQHISHSYFHLMILLSILLRKIEAIRIEPCTPCHQYFHPPVKLCAYVCYLFSDCHCYHWWKPTPPLCTDPIFSHLCFCRAPAISFLFSTST